MMERSKSLAPHTGKVFEIISQLECIKPAIKKELESVGEIREYEVGSFDFVSFNFEGVKLSFYAAPRKAVSSMQRIPYLNNLFIADMESIGAMKMEAMLRRSMHGIFYMLYSRNLGI